MTRPNPLLLLAALALSGAARASDPAAAQVLFNQAREAMRRGDYAHACPMLEESERLDAAIGTKFNLADCYEHDGRTASAWALFLEVAAATRIAAQPAREQEARARAASLVPRLSQLAVAAPVKPVDGLEVRRDGETLGPTQWGMPVPVDPGRHTVVATAPGRAPWRTTVDVPASAQTVSVSIPVLDPATEATAAPATPLVPLVAPATAEQPAPTHGLGAQRVAAIVAGGVGIVGLGVGSAFGLVSLSDHGASENGCNAESVCSPSGAAARTDAIHAGNVSTAAFAIGAVAAAAGVVLWLTAPDADAKVGLASAPSGAALVGTW